MQGDNRCPDCGRGCVLVSTKPQKKFMGLVVQVLKKYRCVNCDCKKKIFEVIR
jgi:hypothetical protein|tara:strand:+ start:1596 stop:1754 length:159 start_codon:yes stop_codon:yes gene_type:complete